MNWILRATLATGAVTVIVIGCTADMRDLNTCHAATVAYCEKIQACDVTFAARFPDGIDSCATQVVTAYRVGKFGVNADSDCPDAPKDCSNEIEASACNARVPDSCGTVIKGQAFSTVSVPVVAGTSSGIASSSGLTSSSSSSGTTGTSSGTSGTSSSSSGGATCSDNGTKCRAAPKTCTSSNQRGCFCDQAVLAQCYLQAGCYKEANASQPTTRATLIQQCQAANNGAMTYGGTPCVTCGP